MLVFWRLIVSLSLIKCQAVNTNRIIIISSSSSASLLGDWGQQRKVEINYWPSIDAEANKQKKKQC